jgi:hypothetical protein
VGLAALVPYKDELELSQKSVAVLLDTPQQLPKLKKHAEHSDSSGEEKKVAEGLWSGRDINFQWDLLASLLVEPLILAFNGHMCLDIVLDTIHVWFLC